MSGERRRMALSDLRRHHLSLVVEALLEDGPRSRAELAQSLGLTKATVSTLVADLLERDVVREHDVRRDGQMGRPSVGVEVRSAGFAALGLEISVDDVAACVVDLRGAVVARRRHRSDNRRARPATVEARLRRVAAAVLADAAVLDVRLVGGAMAVPGLVDPATQSLVVAPNLHWHDVVLAPLAADLGLRLDVENEANLAALAELRHGAGRDLRSFVHLSGGVGIGGGLVLDRTVVRGSNGFAGELGHVVVDPDGPPCACGSHGCLEAMIGGDVDAPAALVASSLATALRSVVHLVDPQAVILGGTLATVDDEVLEEIAERLRSDTIGGRWHACEVRRSTLGPDAALLGAATTALDVFVADPTTTAVPATPRIA